MKRKLMMAGTLMAAMMLALGSAHAEVKVGDKAPKFEMVGSDGKTYTSEQFEGKKVIVIAWYPKAFTGG